MKASTRPCSSVGTTPKALGSSTGVRLMVASASLRRWKDTSSERSESVSTSPFTTTKVSSMPACAAANRMAPAVSSGVGSTA